MSKHKKGYLMSEININIYLQQNWIFSPFQALNYVFYYLEQTFAKKQPEKLQLNKNVDV